MLLVISRYYITEKTETYSCKKYTYLKNGWQDLSLQDPDDYSYNVIKTMVEDR